MPQPRSRWPVRRRPGLRSLGAGLRGNVFWDTLNLPSRRGAIRAGRPAHVIPHGKKREHGRISYDFMLKEQIPFVFGPNCRFAACNHGVQPALHSISWFNLAYCTQQTGGLTRGMTLREIHAKKGAISRYAGCFRCQPSADDIASSVATVQFYAAGPSAPASTRGSRHAAPTVRHAD